MARSSVTIARYGRPDLLLYYDGGIGDELLCTVVLRELRKRDPEHTRNIWMRSAYEELFEGNRDVDRVVPNTFGLKWWTQKLKGEAIYPMYIIWKEDPTSLDYLPPPCHIITRMCQLVGVTGEVVLRPYLNLTPDEIERGKLVSHQVAIQSSGTTARYLHMNKQWYSDRFQAVVNALKGRVNFVQIGSPYDPPLEGALDLRGKTSLREAAAIIKNSDVFLGQVGFQMHLARAVDTRGVIVYGGKELPHQSGYSANENIVTRLACSPCWQENVCDFDRECMKRITPAMVVEGVERQLARLGEPMVEDVERVPDEFIPPQTT